MKKIAAVLSTAVVAAGLALAVAPAADAATTVTVRPGGFVAGLSDTRSAGHVEFRKDGLNVYTDDATSQAKAAEYVAASGDLPDAISLTWRGTQPQPGSQIVFDRDGVLGNGVGDYNILVGEPVYGDDFWYPGGLAKATERGATCPSTTGGSGSDCHGTLAEWQAEMPDAEVYAYGFSLGSGVKGDGVLSAINVDDTTYEFTSLAPVEPPVVTPPVTTPEKPVANVFADYKSVKRGKYGFRTDVTGEAQPAGTTKGANLRFTIKDGKRTISRFTVTFSDRDVFRHSFRPGTGKHVIRVYVTAPDGTHLVDRFAIKTGRGVFVGL